MLELEDVTIRRGRLPVVRGATLWVEAGETVSVVGTNGAGKSSMMLAIAGLLPVAQGAVRFEGRDVTDFSPEARSHAGIALVPEGRWLFPEMTVRECLMLGSFRADLRAGVAARMGRVFDLFPRLAERRDQVVATLSGGEQQMVSIGRALMTGPRLLLLDEPSIGLAPILVHQLFDTLSEIVRDGLTVLLVEQDIEEALRFSRRSYVLSNGEIVLEGPSAELAADPRVAGAYLSA